jgi:hypothetical protein
MAAMSNYLETAIVNAVLRNTTYTSPTTVYVALFTTDPTDANTGTECTGASYVRKAMTFSAPSNGVTSNSSAVEFDQATTSWGTITHMGLYDASTSGNLLFHGALTASKVIDTGDVFKFASAALAVTLA